MDSNKLRKSFLSFFQKHGHKIVSSSSLLPSDPSVLFTTAGMQQFKPYYLGEKSPWGKNVASIQKCIRTSDIEEVGDERHLTFFEMLGNFSFGGYFKEEAIKLAHEFITKELKLEIDYVTVFSPEKVPEGDWRKGVKEDTESYEIWKKVGVPEKKIKKEGIDNFWGPTGEEGPCGPTTEIYVQGIEIWNIVFNEFFCDKDKKLEKLETPGVDTGMGLERLAMVAQRVPTVFETDLFEPVIKLIPKEFDERKKRILADHARAIAFLISDGVRPSNKDQGYILRRLMRRVMSEEILSKKIFMEELLSKIILTYGDCYEELKTNTQIVMSEFVNEKGKFSEKLEKGISNFKKNAAHYDLAEVKNNVMIWREKYENEKIADFIFDMYQSFSIPFEMTIEFLRQHLNFNNETLVDLKKRYDEKFKKHQEISRTASSGMFKGGLADHKPETIRLHTAHHLLLAALQQLFGKQVKQKGSNINSERLRIDFSFDRKLTNEEKKKVEDMINEKIKEGLDVIKKEMPIEEAKKVGAEMEFGVKYGDRVSVYFIQDKEGNIFSKEFCGGPHVVSTDELGKFKIIKEEAVSSGVRRIKAILE